MSYNQQYTQRQQPPSGYQQPLSQPPIRQVNGTAIFILIIIIGAICFGAGWWFGQTHFIQTNCANYPFLLLDPNHFMACQVR